MPRRRWLVLLGLALTYAATNGILIHTLPILYPTLMEAFGWSQSQVTLPATVFFVVGALTSPPAGVLMDRFSPRWIIIIGLLSIVAALIGYSAIAKLGHLIAVYAVFAVALSLCGLVSNMLVLSRWFVDLRGRATGLLLMSSSAGGALFPLLLGATIEAGGWRTAIQVLALVVFCFALLPVIFFVRDRPNTAVSTSETNEGSAVSSTGPTVLEAFGEARFYLVAIATAAVWFSIIGMVQHQSIYLAGDMGIERSQLPMIFSVFFTCSVVGKLLFGWLSDRFDKNTMMLASLVTLAVGLVLLRNVTLGGNITLFAYAVVAGIGFSGAFTMIQLLFANYYAGSSYGKILAILVLVDTLAGALGTRIVARIREASGSYLGCIDLMIGLLVFAFVCIVVADRMSAINNSTNKVTGAKI